MLHGTYGEDGTVQGLLKLANVPFVGAGVLGSAVGMDKDIAKRILRDAGIPVTRSVTLTARTAPGVTFEELVFPDEIHGFLRHSSWLRAYTATAAFLDRNLMPGN